MSSNSWIYAAKVVLPSVGFVAIIGGVLLLYSPTHYLMPILSGTTEGTIVEIETGLSRDGSTEGSGTGRLGVRFETKEGRIVEFLPPFSERSFFPGAGGKVPVLYDPRNPQEAEIDSFPMRWSYALVAMMLGVLAMVLGVCIVYRPFGFAGNEPIEPAKRR